MPQSEPIHENHHINPIWWAVLAAAIACGLLLWLNFSLTPYQPQGAAQLESAAARHGLQICEKTPMTPATGLVEGTTYALALDCNSNPSTWFTVSEVKFDSAEARDWALFTLQHNRTLGHRTSPTIGYAAYGPYLLYTTATHDNPAATLLFQSIAAASSL